MEQIPNRMDSDIKAKWVAALRSGDYEQGSSYLNFKGKFCCLGVLCDLAVKEGLELEVTVWSTPQGDKISYNGAPSTPPPAVCSWAGLTFENGSRNAFGSYVGAGRSLVSLNDTRVSFAQIADIIEKEF